MKRGLIVSLHLNYNGPPDPLSYVFDLAKTDYLEVQGQTLGIGGKFLTYPNAVGVTSPVREQSGAAGGPYTFTAALAGTVVTVTAPPNLGPGWYVVPVSLMWNAN